MHNRDAHVMPAGINGTNGNIGDICCDFLLDGRLNVAGLHVRGGPGLRRARLGKQQNDCENSSHGFLLAAFLYSKE